MQYKEEEEESARFREKENGYTNQSQTYYSPRENQNYTSNRISSRANNTYYGERTLKNNINYSPEKDIIEEKLSSYNSSRRGPQLQSPYATGGHFEHDDESYNRKNFESSQIDKEDNLTDYSLPESSNYHPNYKPRATRIE